MSATGHNYTVSLTAEGEVRLRSDQGDRTLGLTEAFGIGDSMIQTRKYAAALRIFGAIARHHPGNLQILVMLARGRAGRGDYHGCDELLQSAFSNVDFRTAVTLQAAFVYEALGLWNNAISALEKVAERHRELPLLRVLLGDYYLRQGTVREAERCWKSTLSGGDGSNGYVEFIANRRLAHLAKANGPQHAR
jgi:predicted Zn-dependent protease